MIPPEPGSLAELNEIELTTDGPVPEHVYKWWKLRSMERQERMEREAKEGPGSLADKLSLAKRMGLAQRMNRDAAE